MRGYFTLERRCFFNVQLIEPLLNQLWKKDASVTSNYIWSSRTGSKLCIYQKHTPRIVALSSCARWSTQNRPQLQNPIHLTSDIHEDQSSIELRAEMLDQICQRTPTAFHSWMGLPPVGHSSAIREYINKDTNIHIFYRHWQIVSHKYSSIGTGRMELTSTHVAQVRLHSSRSTELFQKLLWRCMIDKRVNKCCEVLINTCPSSWRADDVQRCPVAPQASFQISKGRECKMLAQPHVHNIYKNVFGPIVHTCTEDTCIASESTNQFATTRIRTHTPRLSVKLSYIRCSLWSCRVFLSDKQLQSRTHPSESTGRSPALRK
jgi:hypothetical protein